MPARAAVNTTTKTTRRRPWEGDDMKRRWDGGGASPNYSSWRRNKPRDGRGRWSIRPAGGRAGVPLPPVLALGGIRPFALRRIEERQRLHPPERKRLDVPPGHGRRGCVLAITPCPQHVGSDVPLRDGRKLARIEGDGDLVAGPAEDKLVVVFLHKLRDVAESRQRPLPGGDRHRLGSRVVVFDRPRWSVGANLLHEPPGGERRLGGRERHHAGDSVVPRPGDLRERGDDNLVPVDP